MPPSNIRTTITGTTGKFISREPGTRIGIQVNSFGAQKLMGITGEELAPIILGAMQIAYDDATSYWPVDTGASKDSIELQTMSVEAKAARVALLAGGEKLIQDKRNVSKKDYAPFIEFLGTKTASPGILTNAVIGNDTTIKARIREGVAELLRNKLR